MSKENNNNDSAIILLIVVLCGIIYLIWHFQADNIRNGVRWLRVTEMRVVSLVVGEDHMVRDEEGRDVATLGQIIDFTSKLDKTELSAKTTDLMTLGAMGPLKYVFSLLLTLMAFWALFKGPRTYYRSKLDLNHLIRRQAKNFPGIAPFVSFNPSSQPPRPPGAPVPAELPSFAEALSPEEWIAFCEVPVPNGKVDEEVAARAFSKQLGAPWRGTMHLAPHKQVLLAAFCLKSVRKRAEADSMLGRLSQSWTFEKGLKIKGDLLREARKILRNRDISGKILSKCNQHAYENTVLLRALATAREEGGVLAPAQFVWLRGFDRTLWYPLNNLGRQSYHMEALGAMCHYKAEKSAQRPIPRPKVDDAVKSISEYIASTNARPIPALDYSGSKKRAIKKAKA